MQRTHEPVTVAIGAYARVTVRQRLMLTAGRRPGSADAKDLARQPRSKLHHDCPAKSMRLGDMFVPHLTACRATSRL
jgi:hypothetical protein